MDMKLQHTLLCCCRGQEQPSRSNVWLYRVRSDGKTPERRRRKSDGHKPVFASGEKVCGVSGEAQPQHDLKPRVIEGRHVMPYRRSIRERGSHSLVRVAWFLTSAEPSSLQDGRTAQGNSSSRLQSCVQHTREIPSIIRAFHFGAKECARPLS